METSQAQWDDVTHKQDLPTGDAAFTQACPDSWQGLYERCSMSALLDPTKVAEGRRPQPRVPYTNHP
jgi:hypothetical protein